MATESAVETVTTDDEWVAEPHDADHEHAEHPSDTKYIWIAIILAILTAFEVATYWFEDQFNWGPILIALMLVKGVIVAGYFMHLKFDDNLLRNIFIAGFVLAVGVYVTALTTFTFWEQSGIPEEFPENVRSTPFVAEEDADAEGESAEDGDAAGEEGE